jgi:hypothetical protein
MDLSDGDIKLLTAIRKRSRIAKAVIAIFGLKGLLLTGAAISFAFRACKPSSILDQQDPFLLVEMLVRQGDQFAAGLFGVHALLCLMLCLFTWSQRKSDALTLKLIDKASGYPASSLS